MPTVDIISSIFINAILIIWWVVLPLVLILEIRHRWPDWLVWKHLVTYKYAVLEIIPPPEVLKTPKAMENVLTGISGSWAELNFRDKWWRGAHQASFNLELVAHNGQMRFFVRCREQHKSWVMSKFYAEYPDAEIHEVEDYVDSLPEFAPNVNWDIWGAAYGLTAKNNDWTIPIRTYLDWEDPQDERRMSPLSQFGEMATQLGPYEYVLFQINISPRLIEITEDFKKSIAKLAGRPEEKKPSQFGFIGDILYALVELALNTVRVLFATETQWKKKKEEEPKKEDQNLLWKLTEGERKTIEAVEMKASKVNFEVGIYAMYLFRRDHKHSERTADMNGYFRQFQNNNLNGLRPASKTYPSSNVSYWWFRKDKLNLQRMRHLYFGYKSRWAGFVGPTYMLNVEEIATLFHLPGQIVQAPSLGRIESKKVQPPRSLLL